MNKWASAKTCRFLAVIFLPLFLCALLLSTGAPLNAQEAALAVIRIANEPHLQGVRFWMHLIESQQVDAVRGFVSAVHEWAIPRMLEAVALTHGEPRTRPNDNPPQPRAST